MGQLYVHRGLQESQQYGNKFLLHQCGHLVQQAYCKFSAYTHSFVVTAWNSFFWEGGDSKSCHSSWWASTWDSGLVGFVPTPTPPSHVMNNPLRVLVLCQLLYYTSCFAQPCLLCQWVCWIWKLGFWGWAKSGSIQSWVNSTDAPHLSLWLCILIYFMMPGDFTFPLLRSAMYSFFVPIYLLYIVHPCFMLGMRS